MEKLMSVAMQKTTSLVNYSPMYVAKVILMNWRIITKFTVFSAVISIATVMCLKKKYTSTSLILPPQQQDIGIMGMMLGGGTGGVAANLLGIGTPADQYASFLESNRISDAIIDKFKLMSVYNSDYRVDMYKKLNKVVEIKAGKKDGIISITVEDDVPKRAADIANAYVKELSILTAELNMTGGSQNKQFLEKRLTQARADLSKTEDEIKNFQLKNKSIDVTEQAKASIASIAEIRSQLILQEIQLASLTRRFTDNSQEVKDVRTAINRLKAQIYQLEGTGKGGAIPTVGAMPDLGQEYVRLMREYKIQETLVELLTKQYELAKLTESKDISNIQIIQEAKPADKKHKPKRILIVISTTMLSMVLIIIYLLLKDFVLYLPSETKSKFSELWLMIHNDRKV